MNDRPDPDRPPQVNPGNDGMEPKGQFVVRDRTFIEYLSRLKRLHTFLYREAIPLKKSEAEALQMGDLWLIQYSLKGRLPSLDEWNKVENQTQFIYSIFSGEYRRKFLFSEAPSILFMLPVLLLIVSSMCVVLPLLYGQSVFLGTMMLSCYLFWSCLLGALGALAFIGMNALSIQSDITFDLTNVRLVVLRVVIGALFALVICMPFGFSEFSGFELNLINAGNPGNPYAGQGLSSQTVWLFAPLILGFSTTSVILIMNHLVDAIGSFFGQNPNEKNSEVTEHDRTT